MNFKPLSSVKQFGNLSKKKKKMIMIIVAASVLVLAACYTVFIAPLLEKEEWVYKEEIVERGTLKVGVTESGALEYGITEVLYDLDLDISSDDDDEEEEDDEEVVQKYLKIEEVYIKAGQRISEGDMLFKFTADSVADVHMLLQSATVEAQLEYAEAQSEYEISVLEAKADYEIQKMTGDYANDVYQNNTALVDNEILTLQIEINQRTANITSLEEAIVEAQEAYDEAWANFKDAVKPHIENESNIVNFVATQKAYLSKQTQYENAKSALTRAQESLSDNATQIASLQEELATLNAQRTISKLEAEGSYYEDAIGGENAKINYEAQLESLKETLKEEEAEKEKIEEQLAAFETFVGEDGCLYASGTGIVTEVSYSAGDTLRIAGTMASYAMPTDMTISVDVTQEDIVDLQVGDKVDITFAAYPDTPFVGNIQSINTTATSTSSNTVSYTIVIAVEGDTTSLYGGMTADVVFVTEQKDDILFVSKKAIVKQDGKTYVYYKTRLGGKELKEVEVGIDNGVDIEIISGLEEGDVIYLASRVSSSTAVMSTTEGEDADAQGNSQNGEGNRPNFGSEEMPDFGGGSMPDFGGGEMPSMLGGGNMPDFGGGNMPSRGGR